MLGLWLVLWLGTGYRVWISDHVGELQSSQWPSWLNGLSFRHPRFHPRFDSIPCLRWRWR